MSSGDSLTIHGGTYGENNLRPPSAVTIEGAPGERVVLRPTGGTAAGFELSGVHGTTIRNLVVDGAGGGVSYGIRIAGQDNTVENVEVANVQNQGIAVYCPDGSNHQRCGHGGNTLRNVHVHGSGTGGCHGTTAKDGFCHGVYVYSDDNVIDGGEFDHNNGWGIQTYGFNLKVTGVFVHDNVSGGLTIPGSAQVSNSIFTGNNPSGQAAVIWAGSNASFKDLTIKDNPSIGLFLPGGTHDVTVENVLSTDNKPNLRNDMGMSVNLNGTGASLVPGQSTALAQAVSPAPAPRNFRVMSLP